jgi:hypothetical protein
VLVEDPKWELAILATVQGFCEKLLQAPVGGEIPVPAQLETISLQQSGDVHETLALMRRWLRLLDLAITPALLRQAFTTETDPEIAEALLRYFTRNKDGSDTNRDKTDLIATFLYRHPRVPGQWERRGYGLDGSLPLSPFEIALIEILADSDVPELPEEHLQALRVFDSLQEEAHRFNDLHSLLESGIITRVRELKQSLEASFYHPSVLATIASYNARFGRKFDDLFHQATAEIRALAGEVRERGGSILGTVDGMDITVDHVNALQELELLKLDYAKALDKFRRVSKLKITLEREPPIRHFSQPLQVSAISQVPSPKLRPTRPVVNLEQMRAGITPQQIATEEAKLRQVEESVRIFVRVADPKMRQVIPMRFFNLTLTPAEVEAFSCEKPSGDSAAVSRTLMRIVAVLGRISTETEEIKRSANSHSLWKLHADSLTVLLQISRSVTESASHVACDSESIAISLQKLRERCLTAQNVLEQAERDSQLVS